MNPENSLNLIDSINQLDSNSFRPYSLDIGKDFVSNSDLFLDINKSKYDELLKRGLIMQTQKVYYI
jgi:hypothetical protein